MSLKVERLPPFLPKDERAFREFASAYGVNENDVVYAILAKLFVLEEKFNEITTPEGAKETIASAFSEGLSTAIEGKINISMGQIKIDYGALSKLVVQEIVKEELILREDKKEKSFTLFGIRISIA